MTARDELPYPILELARWAPSGDNTQPWRFEVCSTDEVVVHVQQPSAENPYEYHAGQPSWLAVGGLLESMRIAATRWGRRAEWRRSRAGNDGERIEVRFLADSALTEDPRLPSLLTRSVDRRPYRIRPLSADDRARLEEAVRGSLSVQWFASLEDRRKWAAINARATWIRLSIVEAYRVHQGMLDWERPDSPTGIPARAVGLDAGTTVLMRWAMQDWRRVDSLNRFLGGTIVPRLELDLLPGLCSGAFFTLAVETPIESGNARDRWLDAGAAFQRFWLEATTLGLVLQPTLAPLAFAAHGREGTPFTKSPKALRASKRLAEQVARQIREPDIDSVLVLGRIGYPARPTEKKARSTRRSLDELIIRPPG